MYQAKQTVADLAFTQKDWTQALPEGYRVELRMESKRIAQYRLPSGDVKHCTPLQWYLGGGNTEGMHGTALRLVKPDGQELPGVFHRVIYR